MKRILAFAFSVAVNVALLVSLQHVGDASLPKGVVYVTEGLATDSQAINAALTSGK